MGYHIKIHIVNHCDTDVTYTGSDHTNDGEIEDGPYDAPAGKTTCVFVAKAKDAKKKSPTARGFDGAPAPARKGDSRALRLNS